jgi:hypothetical protein
MQTTTITTNPVSLRHPFQYSLHNRIWLLVDVSAMGPIDMAVMAKCDEVLPIEAERLIRRPRLNMVNMKAYATLVAEEASKVVTPLHFCRQSAEQIPLCEVARGHGLVFRQPGSQPSRNGPLLNYFFPQAAARLRVATHETAPSLFSYVAAVAVALEEQQATSVPCGFLYNYKPAETEADQVMPVLFGGRRSHSIHMGPIRAEAAT